MTDVWVFSRSDGKPDVECGSEFAAEMRKKGIEAALGSRSVVQVVVWARRVEDAA